MKILVTMKDPDSLYECVMDAIKDDVRCLNLEEDEAKALVEVRHEKAMGIASQWFEYGEYLTVEIDTVAKTCVVVKN